MEIIITYGINGFPLLILTKKYVRGLKSIVDSIRRKTLANPVGKLTLLKFKIVVLHSHQYLYLAAGTYGK